ncbi:MAG: hypothetical protein ABH886_01035 [Candidatus Desantisbacteria bacterium]
MEDLDDNEKYEVEEENRTYKILQSKGELILIGAKSFFFIVGVFITILLSGKLCNLFDPNYNTIATIYFAIVGLMFFHATGFAIDKLIPNIKLT